MDICDSEGVTGFEGAGCLVGSSHFGIPELVNEVFTADFHYGICCERLNVCGVFPRFTVIL